MKRIYFLIFALLGFGSGISNAQYTVLHNFSGIGGTHPNGSLIISGNMLYGMTELGGAYNEGCIFSIDTNGIGYRKLYDFDGTDGAYPLGIT
jgi:uncharacterized repeat protein (TIGR03803 family)